jgi:hypothetical protein
MLSKAIRPNKTLLNIALRRNFAQLEGTNPGFLRRVFN